MMVHDGVYDGVYDGVNDVMRQILESLSTPKSTPELLDKLGYPRRTRNYDNAMRDLLETRLIEMTIPDKPRSKNQKYRLTEKGRIWLTRDSDDEAI